MRTLFKSLFRNPAIPHAARTAIAAVFSLLIAGISQLPEPYWAAVSTLIVMQSALGSALPIARRRFVGTALGAAIGAFAGTYFPGNIWVFGVSVFLLGVICAALAGFHHTLRTSLDYTTYRYAAITLAIIVLVTRPHAAWLIALHRFIEVSIGILVALLMTVVWPRPE